MKRKLFYSLFLSTFLIFLTSQTVQAAKNKMYSVDVGYVNNLPKIGEVLAKEGFIPTRDKVDTTIDFFTLKLLSFDGLVLEQVQFNTYSSAAEGVHSIIGEKVDDQTIMEFPQSSYVIFLPYHNDGEKMELYDHNNVVLDSRSIAYLSNVCGDGVCQEHENYTSCSGDCLDDAKDDYCNKEKIQSDPDCELYRNIDSAPAKKNIPVKNIDFKFNKSGSNIMIYVGIGLMVLLLLVVVFVVWYKKNRE